MSNFYSHFLQSWEGKNILNNFIEKCFSSCSNSYAPVNFLTKILEISSAFVVFPNVIMEIKNIPVVTTINHAGVYVKWERRLKVFSKFLKILSDHTYLKLMDYQPLKKKFLANNELTI